MKKRRRKIRKFVTIEGNIGLGSCGLSYLILSRPNLLDLATPRGPVLQSAELTKLEGLTAKIRDQLTTN